MIGCRGDLGVSGHDIVASGEWFRLRRGFGAASPSGSGPSRKAALGKRVPSRINERDPAPLLFL